MKNGLTTKNCEFITSKELTLALQAGLISMGYKVSKVDGVLEHDTIQALLKFLDDWDNGKTKIQLT